ncbi:hypothetical protein COJ70_24280 [Priestia megaterium]|nr:hypothetical protein COJ70_24280 [Priestia megaterium]
MDVMFKKDINSKVGSIILSNLVFFNSPVYLSKIGIEFPNSIVSGKSINSLEVQAILTKGLARTSDLEKTLKENIENSQVGFTEDDFSFPEGRLKLKQHLIRERNPKVIKTAKNKFKEKHGRVFCEVCNFDFEKHYGEIGEDYIEGHHIKPVSELKEGEETKIEDIKLVCSNCHRMLHRKRPWLKVEELKKLFTENN